MTDPPTKIDRSFSIGELLAYMTAWAITLGGMRMAIEIEPDIYIEGSFDFSLDTLRFVGLILCFLALVVVAVALSCLSITFLFRGRTRVWLRTAKLMAVLFLLYLLVQFFVWVLFATAYW